MNGNMSEGCISLHVTRLDITWNTLIERDLGENNKAMLLAVWRKKKKDWQYSFPIIYYAFAIQCFCVELLDS